MSEFEWDENKFEEVFEYLDIDGSSELTLDELQKGSLMQAAQLLDKNPTDEEVQQFLDDLHKDDDGVISKEEFRAYLQDFIAKLHDDPNAMLEKAVGDMMDAIDTDGNGVCSKEEFKTFLRSKGSSPLSEEDIDELFNQIDTDEDTSTLNKQDLLGVLLIGMSQCQ